MMRAFLLFSRPHTIIGTTLSISTLYLLAMGFSDRSDWHLSTLLLTLLACLGANIFIVGLNQITDVEIDKINKPYLPLASGDFSMRTGYWIVGISIFISLFIAFILGRYLLATVLASLFLGTIYSLPPFRLKRFHFWAAFCIIAVRGLIVNLLLFLHFHYSINGLQTIPIAVWILTAVIFVYSVTIAWFKDMPDMEGDRQFQINTLSIKLGAKKVFWIGNALIISSYLLLFLIPLSGDAQLSLPVIWGAHILFFGFLLWAGSRINFSDQKSVFQYYQMIWVLFFLEYISFATAALV
ncbi:MAG: homogentisate phytyltransferase [Bacteroidota bacterium]